MKNTIKLRIALKKLRAMGMISNPDYIKSAEHRIAGLEGQLNIETNSEDIYA